MTTPESVIDLLERARSLGVLGEAPVRAVWEHSHAFVDAITHLRETGGLAPRHRDGRLRVVDIGSGGGVPGLVIAAECDEVVLTLVDRRAQRTDLLERAVRRLGWTDRVDVRCVDLSPTARWTSTPADVVTARGFGPPETTVRCAAPMLRSGGYLLISEPPSDRADRWIMDGYHGLDWRMDVLPIVEGEDGRIRPVRRVDPVGD